MAYDLDTTFPNLPNAPITEALIDFRCDLPSDLDLQHLAAFGEGDATLEKRDEIVALEARIEHPKGKPPVVTGGAVNSDGYIFRFKTGFAAQVRRNGFAVSRMPPYRDGDQLEDEVKRLWQRYCIVARPTNVTRAAIRTINRIPIEPGLELQRYVLTAPEISRSLPQTMLDFFLRIVVPDESGAIGIIHETMERPRQPGGQLSLIFDIEVFRDVKIGPTDNQLWLLLQQLRQMKNRIFFRSLTSECLERFR